MLNSLYSRTKQLLVVAVTPFLFNSPVMAANLLVDDGSDGTTGCTLRSAIESVNNGQNTGGCVADGDYGDNDSIDFSVAAVSGLVSTLHITGSVAVNPAGAALSITSIGNGGVFNIDDAVVSFDNVLMTGGDSSSDGGGILATDSTVTLRNCTIEDNTVSDAGGDGGGIFIEDTNLTLIDSTVIGNTTQDDGGGIFVENSTLILENSTVANNIAGSEGGGINIFGQNGSGTMTNTTISGNTAMDEGGGIHLRFNGSASLINTTVSNNTAIRTGGGISIAAGQSLTMSNSLVAGNFSDLTSPSAFAEVFVGSRTLNLLGINLLGDSSKTNEQAFDRPPSGNAILATSDGNRATGIASILSPLADNSGATLTHALTIGSPATSTGSFSDCPETDQRGIPRDDETSFYVPVIATNDNIALVDLGGNTCDIGSFEFDNS